MTVRLIDLEELLEPVWEREGFHSYDDYAAHYVDFVYDKLSESKNHWRDAKQGWFSIDKRLELDKARLSSLLSVSSAPLNTDLPLVPLALEDSVANRMETLPTPSVVPRQASQQEFVGALNYFIEEELDANDYHMLMARVALDVERFNVGAVKLTVDSQQTGPFGQDNKLILRNIDPRHIWPDPYAKSFRWDDCRYFITEEPEDLESIRGRYPDHGFLVKPEKGISLSRDDDGKEVSFQFAESDENADDLHMVKRRHRVKLVEMWLKDERLIEVPDRDDDGRVVKDENGDPVTKLEKLYPHGRVLVVANGVLLADMPNPFRHGQPPYAFFMGRISHQLLTYGNVELLYRIEDKINRLHKSMMQNAVANMNTPWVIDRNAFDSPQQFKNITHEPGLVLPVTPGSHIQRLPPAELPQFIYPLVSFLRQQFDEIVGVGGVSRGQLEKGAQLSAEAIQALQGTSTQKLRLRSQLWEQGLKQLGYLLQWNIRQFYQSGRSYVITDPSTLEPKPIFWGDEVSQGDYAVSIEAGSSLPGAKQGKLQLGLTLWRDGVIGRRTLLKMIEFPNAEAVAEERQKELRELAQANLQAAVKEGYRNSSARGRKPTRMSV